VKTKTHLMNLNNQSMAHNNCFTFKMLYLKLKTSAKSVKL
jgi:hypothetical protein